MMETPEGKWTTDALLELGRSYQGAAILLAAAELDLFTRLRAGPKIATELAVELQCDPRGMRLLLDALVALGLTDKLGDTYRLPSGLESLLTATGDHSILAMAQHQANCLRNWAQLAEVVQTGRPAPRIPSIRGESRDQEAFIEAMHCISAPNAAHVIEPVRTLPFRHLLDIGGGSGTWTIAFLRACPSATATVFDLPAVIPLAARRMSAEGLTGRVQLVPGDFMADALPAGADLAWISAIVHQNSRAENQTLFAKVFRALLPGGHIAIRDMVMDKTHTQPVAGALFAINMLVATQGGGTFSFDELREDLEKTGFVNATQSRQDLGMNSVVIAEKPS
ncbi:MAG: methyltransferase [Limisphaerales bacterium]